jgi:hypothetical protein
MRLRTLRDNADPANDAPNLRKWETSPCRDFIDPTKAPTTYAAFLVGAAFDYDFLNFGDPAFAGNGPSFALSAMV